MKTLGPMLPGITDELEKIANAATEKNKNDGKVPAKKPRWAAG